MIKEKTILLDQLETQFAGSKVQEDALAMLHEIGLPHKKSEAYKYTAITAALEKSFDPSLKGHVEIRQKDFFETTGNHLVIKDGVFLKDHSRLVDELVIEEGTVTEGKHDPFSLLNTAFSVSELNIHVKKAHAPVFIYHYNSVGFVNPRMKVHVNKNQEINIVEKFFSEPGVFCNAYIQFDLEENAAARYTKIQQYHQETISHEGLFVHQARDSRFYTNTFSFSGGLIRNNLTLYLEGENCEGYMNGLYLLDSNSHVDNNTSADHIKPNSYSNELYKGILDEKSTGVFNGKIYVRPDAQKTNAFQANNNILLSDEATVNTKPQLEIWADDVKCSHGCTSGQLDEDAIFYLRARGINEKNAKAMLLNAFAAETLQHIQLEEVKNELEALIANRLT